MPTYPDDISYEKFLVILEPFINDKSKISSDKKIPGLVQSTLKFLPTDEGSQIFCFDRKRNKLLFTDMSKGGLVSDEVTAANFAEILKDIWNEKAYLMLNYNPSQYLPFKKIVEKVLDDFNLQNENLQQKLLDETSLVKVLVGLIAQYLDPETEDLIQAIKLHGFFEVPEKRKSVDSIGDIPKAFEI